MKTAVTTEDCSLSLAIDNYFPTLADSEVNRLFRDRDIRVNGIKTGDRKQRVAKGSEITVYEKKSKEKFLFLPVYEDEELLVVDKEQGVNSEGLYYELSKQYPFLAFIHRLDRNTAGLIVFAKTPRTERGLREAFEKRSAQKTYHALVVGKPNPARKVAEAYLRKNASKSVVSVFDRQVDGAEKIVTGYEVVRAGNGFSLLSVDLITGKTHQIRAHLAFMGYPILGDEKYGNEQVNAKYHVKRQQLLAKSLTVMGKTFTSDRELPLSKTEMDLW